MDKLMKIDFTEIGVSAEIADNGAIPFDVQIRFQDYNDQPRK